MGRESRLRAAGVETTDRAARRLIDSPGIVAVLSGDKFTSPQFALSLAMTQAPPAGATLRWYPGYGTAAGRNEAIADALKAGAAWLWFLDDDLVFEPDTLVSLLRHDADLVQPLVLARLPPHRACAEVLVDVPRDEPAESLLARWDTLQSFPVEPQAGCPGLIDVDLIGAGGLLIAVQRVAARLLQPWFVPMKGSRGGGEDTSFALHARAAGLRAVVDPVVCMGHETRAVVWPAFASDGSFAFEYQHSSGNWRGMAADVSCS